MQKATQVKSNRTELILAECQATFSAAPVSASLAVANSTNGKITMTSIRGEDIGNATTFTITDNGTNAIATALTGYNITVKINTDGTNTSTASNVKAALEADTNGITNLITVVTNVAGDMATKTKTSFTGGDDKITVTTTSPVLTLTRDSKGVYDLVFDADQLKLADYVGAMVADMSGDAGSSGVAKVEVVQESADNEFTVRTFDYAGAAGDVTAASKLHLVLAGQRFNASREG